MSLFSSIIKKSLITRLVVFSILIVLLPNLILAIISFSYTRSRIYSQVGSEVMPTVNDIAKEVDQRLYDCFMDMLKISKSTLVKESGSNAKIKSYLKTFNRMEYNYEGGGKYKKYFSLALINSRGRVLSKTEGIGNSKVEGDWIEGVFQGNYFVSDFLSTSRFNNKPTMIFCAPVLSSNGRVNKAVIGWLDMEYIRDPIEDVSRTKRENKFGELAYIRLFTPDGRIVNSKKDENINDDLSQNVFKGEADYAISSMKGGDKTIISYSTLPGLSKRLEKSWKLAVFQPVNDTSMGWLVLIPKIRRTVLITTVIVCMIAIVIAFFIGNNIARPIKRLARASKKAMEGDLNVSVSLKSFREDEIGMLVKFFNHSIANIKFYLDKFEWLSITDELTKSYNKRFFEKTFNNEMSRAERYRRSIALVMMDIDKFKGFNDTYGHQVGEDILIQMAKIFQGMIRGSDYSCRYGEDKFALILTETRAEEAYLIAERIRKRVEVFLFRDREKKVKLKLTISSGVASYHEGKKSMDEMITKADKALSKAKESGRNLVIALE